MFPSWTQPFSNRAEAGRALAKRLASHATADTVVIGLPRGGVPVAFEVAKALGAPLDVVVVRKLGVPGHEELAMGAIASGGVIVMNDDIVRGLRIPEAAVQAAIARERRVLAAREQLWRSGQASPSLHGRDVILVDDGIATGASARVAIRAVRARGARRVILAAPVAPAALGSLGEDELVLVEAANPFYAVGAFYQDFSQTTDAEVSRLLDVARAWTPAPA